MKSKSTDSASTNRFAQVNENGFLPNSFQTPNAIVDKYGPYLTSDEIRVWLYACRHILGWGDKISSRRRRISLSMFINGYGLFPGCGLNRGAIIQALNGLFKYGLLLKIGAATQDGQMWEIPSKETKIDFQGLLERRNLEIEKHVRKTIKARIALTKKRAEKEIERSVGQTTTRSVGQTTCDGSEGAMEIDVNDIKEYTLERQVVCGTDHLDHLNHNTENDLQENENLPGGLWDRPQAVCGTDLNKPTSKPNLLEQEVFPSSNSKTKKISRSEISSWWDETAIPAYEQILGYNPGALMRPHDVNGLQEHAERVGIEKLTECLRRYLETAGYKSRKYPEGFYTKNNHDVYWFVEDFTKFAIAQKNGNGKHNGNGLPDQSGFLEASRRMEAMLRGVAVQTGLATGV